MSKLGNNLTSVSALPANILQMRGTTLCKRTGVSGVFTIKRAVTGELVADERAHLSSNLTDDLSQSGGGFQAEEGMRA